MKNQSMDLLKYEAFPELAAATRASIPEVISRWQSVVREVIAPARDLADTQIQNDLPAILVVVADALASNEPKYVKNLMDESVIHGEVRFDQNFDIGELLIEYGLLRRVLLQVVTQRLERDLTAEETMALNEALDVVSRRGVVVFAAEQRTALQSVAEAQSKYLSFLSHDLRGGLNGVLLMIEVLRRDLNGVQQFSESLTDLDTMRRSILETVSTMDRFLHAERFRKGKVVVQPESVDLRSIAQDVVSQFIYQARDKKIDLHSEIAESIVLRTDRELVTVILQNFVSNAVKYSKPGGMVRIVAGCANATADMACRISVIDTGPGITPERLNQLFAAFTRGETHGQQGMGLGLSIARQAADLLNARVLAESKAGEGSTFHVDLPNIANRDA